MTLVRSQALRQALAAVLTLVLALGSIGRGLATATEAPGAGHAAAALTIAGLLVPICHGGAGEAPAPGDPSQHDCCGPCLLGAPALPPGPPSLAEPIAVARPAAPARAAGLRPILARERTPRQSRGPPVLG